MSLLAVTGIHQDMERAPGTALQLLVHIGLATLRALVDSSLSHNFINTDCVASTGLQVIPRTLLVTVANGEKVPCAGVLW